MRRHAIVGCCGPQDTDASNVDQEEVVTLIDFFPNDRSKGEHGIGKALGELGRVGLSPSGIGCDFLIVAALIYAADTRISRISESQDNWTREIHIVSPVSNPTIWANASGKMVRMMNFLTGDKWRFDFKSFPRDFTFPVSTSTNINAPIVYDSVNLFSGGLDSLVGAIDQIEAGRTPLFVSHTGEGAISSTQDRCFDHLVREYRGRNLHRLRVWLNFPDGTVRDVASEDSTRGRSFLFLALGVCAGTSFSEPFNLLVPENGLISLNVPLDPTRLGALSTRTTHPFYLECWNSLLHQLNVSGHIENPYWNKTKGEMVSQCSGPRVLRDVIAQSMSCSSVTKSRWQGRGPEHCGHCVPCIIRRAGILHAYGAGNDPTRYTVEDLCSQPLNSRTAVGGQVRAFQVAIRRLLGNPELAKTFILKPGPLNGDGNQLAEWAGVYQRGMLEVAQLLTGVETTPDC